MSVGVACAPYPIKALHAHRGKKPLQDLKNLDSTIMKRVMVRFRRAREKGVIAIVVHLEVSQEDTTENPLWRETLHRSLASHEAVGLVGGMCNGNGCRPETTRIHAISLHKRDGALSPTIKCSTRQWLDPFARAKSSLSLKTHGPSQKEVLGLITRYLPPSSIYEHRPYTRRPSGLVDNLAYQLVRKS